MNITKRDYVVAGVSCLLGIVLGAVGVGATKASRLADDVHAVKQDYDKSKRRIADDYVHAADKTREVLDNIDTADIGSTATTGVKKLGSEAADGARAVGRAWRERLRGLNTQSLLDEAHAKDVQDGTCARFCSRCEKDK